MSWQKWGSKQALEKRKTSLSLMEVFNIALIAWPAMSSDMNPIEHVWGFIGRKINQRNPKCQNIDELRTRFLCRLTALIKLL
jgi:transposase